MDFTIWHSSECMADFIIDHTLLREHNCTKRKIAESDASKPKEFHKVPDHLKKILYLDAPDIIVEFAGEPIFSFEDSKEAGTGHNVFQRFSRLAAAAENKIPAFYLYPEAVAISRTSVSSCKWDVLNPLIFKALNRLMEIYNTPALLFYYPNYYRDCKNMSSGQLKQLRYKGLKLDENNLKYASCPIIDSEIFNMFSLMDDLIASVISKGPQAVSDCLKKQNFSNRRNWHFREYCRMTNNDNLSPITSTIKIPTSAVLKYIKQKAKVEIQDSIINTRQETIIYRINAKFRGDPYPGALAALDYLLCRNGKTFEDRQYNLLMAWGDVQYNEATDEILITGDDSKSVTEFCNSVSNSERKNLLGKSYSQLKKDEIPRYYMQVRYGSTYSKSKEIRIYAYFCDAILFYDGVLWREG